MADITVDPTKWVTPVIGLYCWPNDDYQGPALDLNRFILRQFKERSLMARVNVNRLVSDNHVYERDERGRATIAHEPFYVDFLVEAITNSDWKRLSDNVNEQLVFPVPLTRRVIRGVRQRPPAWETVHNTPNWLSASIRLFLAT